MIMDFSDDNSHYNQLLDKLAKRLKIARHPDNSVTIEAAKTLIEDSISNQSREVIISRANDKFEDPSSSIQSSKFNVVDIPLPKFLSEICDSNNSNSTSSDKTNPNVLAHSARCLKLLYLEDQRQLQNQVNQAISSIQSLTADPKTDMKQMAVGR